jgi:peptidoglycan/LPS O-acetylase OafA/YrhL
MLLVAVSLAVMSFLHLHGNLHHGTPPFQPNAAGVAEAVIGAVLLLGVAARTRTAAIAAIGFAIVGFGVGLTFTATGGDPIDIAYHAVTLPILIASMGLALLESRSTNDPTAPRMRA